MFNFTLQKRGRQKGSIPLNNMKTIETVEDGKLDTKKNVFQVLVTFTGDAMYRKVTKFSDSRKLCCYHSKIQTKWPNQSVFCPKYADRMANSEDPDQTALGLHCWPRPICPKT